MTAIPVPRTRRLRGYAIDPSLSTALLTMQVNELTYEVPWEDLEPREDYDKGHSYPVGEYIAIVDHDPASRVFYEPVNLDHPHLLAQNGLAPSVSNPQFHQQFLYAVIMTTIKNFEKALGRKVLWGEDLRIDEPPGPDGKRPLVGFHFVQRLRVYPHALRQANAFYDPNRKALLFGYFESRPIHSGIQLPGSTVFTCLSHDIIAHETTHAILDGIHRRYIDATDPDTRAFHEAFADIVALFQHFSFPDVLRHQVAQTRGDLKRQNILGQLAQQFGQAIGGYGSLRDAIGTIGDAGNWVPHKPDPSEYLTKFEVHDRGAILVAAIFEAFLNIYEAKSKKILRIATGGTGQLNDGELPHDLVDELSQIAAGCAKDVLRICIRALDYCPPMDLTFGDYLRAIITADFDMVADDGFGYRVAFVEAFQKRGISPYGARSMAVEDLLYPLMPLENTKDIARLGDFLRKLRDQVGYLANRKMAYEHTKKLIRGESGLHHQLLTLLIEQDGRLAALTGLMFPPTKAKAEALGLEWGYLSSGAASYAVGNVWLANRTTPDDTIVNHVIITLSQKRGVRFTGEGDSLTVDEEGFFVPDNTDPNKWGVNSISFRGGCTLIFDLDTLRLRYVIRKDIDDRARMIRQYRHEKGSIGSENETYFSSRMMNALAGPFAFTHSHTNP